MQVSKTSRRFVYLWPNRFFGRQLKPQAHRIVGTRDGAVLVRDCYYCADGPLVEVCLLP